MEPDVAGLIGEYRRQVFVALQAVPEERIMAAVEALRLAHHRQGRVFVLCLPGDVPHGSHLAQELARGIWAGSFAFQLVRLEGLPRAVVSRDNDWAYEEIYAGQMRGQVRLGDTVVAVWPWGQGLAMLRPLQAAMRSGATTIAIVGPGGDLARDHADVCLHVRADAEEQVEDVQTILVHMLCIALRRTLSLPAGGGASVDQHYPANLQPG
jgi:phosphoheptose isomerase